MADQRPAKFPVTFALHIMLLAEHNRCCVDVAPELGYEGDEVRQHSTRLLSAGDQNVVISCLHLHASFDLYITHGGCIARCRNRGQGVGPHVYTLVCAHGSVQLGRTFRSRLLPVTTT